MKVTAIRASVVLILALAAAAPAAINASISQANQPTQVPVADLNIGGVSGGSAGLVP